MISIIRLLLSIFTEMAKQITTMYKLQISFQNSIETKFTTDGKAYYSNMTLPSGNNDNKPCFIFHSQYFTNILILIKLISDLTSYVQFNCITGQHTISKRRLLTISGILYSFSFINWTQFHYSAPSP